MILLPLNLKLGAPIITPFLLAASILHQVALSSRRTKYCCPPSLYHYHQSLRHHTDSHRESIFSIRKSTAKSIRTWTEIEGIDGTTCGFSSQPSPSHLHSQYSHYILPTTHITLRNHAIVKTGCEIIHQDRLNQTRQEGKYTIWKDSNQSPSIPSHLDDSYLDQVRQGSLRGWSSRALFIRIRVAVADAVALMPDATPPIFSWPSVHLHELEQKHDTIVMRNWWVGR